MHLNFLQFAAVLKFYSNNNTDCHENHVETTLQQFTNIDFLRQFVIGDCGESIDPDWPIYFSPDCLQSKCCQFLQDIDRFDVTTVSLVKFIDFSIGKFTIFGIFRLKADKFPGMRQSCSFCRQFMKRCFGNSTKNRAKIVPLLMGTCPRILENGHPTPCCVYCAENWFVVAGSVAKRRLIWVGIFSKIDFFVFWKFRKLKMHILYCISLFGYFWQFFSS